MTEDEFWAIVDAVNAGAGGDPDVKEQVLKEQLETLEGPAVEEFAHRLDTKMAAAYTWPLWGAAYIIHGGCSDDGFMDFRSCVIFLGREIHDAALENPDSLAALDDDTLLATENEGLLYIPSEVCEEKTGASPRRSESHPHEPTGEQWNEDDEASLSALCPKLWERFGV